MASDNDPLAVRTALANARRNRAAWIEFIAAEGLGARPFRVRAPFDLVFANILLPPLKRLAGPMARIVWPRGGIIVLSGLLVAQENAALAAYRAHGLRLERRIRLDEWVTLVVRAPSYRTRRIKPGPVAARAHGQ